MCSYLSEQFILLVVQPEQISKHFLEDLDRLNSLNLEISDVV